MCVWVGGCRDRFSAIQINMLEKFPEKYSIFGWGEEGNPASTESFPSSPHIISAFDSVNLAATVIKTMFFK